MKYTRESAMARLKRNGVEIKAVTKQPRPTEKNPFPDTYILYLISTRGLGIKLQGAADYLINKYYDMARI